MPTGIYKRIKPIWNKGKKLHYSIWNKGKNKKDFPQLSNSGVKKGQFTGDKNPFYGKKHSNKTKEKISFANKNKISWNKGKKLLYLQKENNWKWKKDRTQLVKSEKKHLDGRYREWMFSVKNRDNWKCRLLSSECKGRLESHHILNWKNYPELRYIINNGITLCAFHHPRGREEEKRMIPIFQELLSVSKE